MELFWKATGFILITVVLGLVIGRAEKDFSVLLTMTACCIVAAAAASYLEPVLSLLLELNKTAGKQTQMLEILLKAVGISVVSELAGSICGDAGNSSLGKILQLVGSAAILFLSIPLFRGFLTLLQEILGEL